MQMNVQQLRGNNYPLRKRKEKTNNAEGVH